MKKKMMRIKAFCQAYDLPYTTAIQLVHSKDFPAYKLGRSWYVDIPEFLKWRETEHKRSYKYAE